MLPGQDRNLEIANLGSLNKDVRFKLESHSYLGKETEVIELRSIAEYEEKLKDISNPVEKMKLASDGLQLSDPLFWGQSNSTWTIETSLEESVFMMFRLKNAMGFY